MCSACPPARRFGGIYVPANQSVIHSYAREALAGCGRMILGSDSHTRYGALGTLGVGEGGPELVKQLLRNTYDIDRPGVVLVWLTGSPRHGIGPHDAALALGSARPSPPDLSRTGFWSSQVPAWLRFPSTSGTASMS